MGNLRANCLSDSDGRVKMLTVLAILLLQTFYLDAQWLDRTAILPFLYSKTKFNCIDKLFLPVALIKRQFVVNRSICT